MPRLSRAKIAAAFAAGDVAATAHARGEILEDLLVYLMRRIPGVRFQERDVLVANGSEEIDLVFWNDRAPSGLPFMPWLLIFECKNWASPVGSAAVGFFRMKAEERHLEAAILVAANGVTGDVAERSAACNIIDTAFVSAARLQLIVITRAEIEALASTEQFVRLLQNKISKIVMRLNLL